MSDLNSVMRPQDHTIYTNLNAFEDLKRQAREDQHAVLKPVAQQFEALFVEQILKNSRKVKLDDGWLDGSQADTYYDMYDKQLAQEIATKGSLGFADQIVKQLSSGLPTLDGEKKQQWLEQQTKQIDEKLASSPSTTQQALAMRKINPLPNGSGLE